MVELGFWFDLGQNEESINLGWLKQKINKIKGPIIRTIIHRLQNWVGFSVSVLNLRGTRDDDNFHPLAVYDAPFANFEK